MINRELPAVRLDGVIAGSREFTLGPLHVEIPRGYVTAIVGVNGSGKSTLFRLLLGLEPVRQGTLEVLGTAVVPGGDERYKAKVGFVAENGHMHEHAMTVAEKAAFAALWYPEWDDARYRKLLKRLDIDEKSRLGKLSKGMRRRAELAIALAHYPDLLLLDEPTSGLDPLVWKIWLDEMKHYMENENHTLVLATHATEEVHRVADFVMFMHRGRMLAFCEKDRLFDEWRELIVRDTAVDALPGSQRLADMAGVCEIADTGRGEYRILMHWASEEELQQHLLTCGFQVLNNRRMELEDILNGIILKEETDIEPA